MSRMTRSAFLLVPCFAFFLTGVEVTSADSTTAAAAKISSCSAPEYHQFDFWVGDWDVYDFAHPAAKIAHARISRILGSCVILEDYREAGTHGESFSIYDKSRKVWHQTWVTNQGRLLEIEGNFRDGEMDLSGADRTLEGRERHVRGTWKAMRGGVRETAWTSMDAGKTWQLWFDIIFRPHHPEPVLSSPQSHP